VIAAEKQTGLHPSMELPEAMELQFTQSQSEAIAAALADTSAPRGLSFFWGPPC
jgi:hypothetical protein